MSPSIAQWSQPLIEAVTIPEHLSTTAARALDRQPDADQLKAMLGIEVTA